MRVPIHVNTLNTHLSPVTFRDYVVYGLIMLGLIVSPTAIFNSTPLYCTLCTKEGQCGPHPPAPDDPGYHAWWVNLLKVLHFLPAMMEAVMFPCSGMSELSAPTQPSESLLFTFRTSCSCLPSSCSVLRSSQTKLSNTKDRWRRFTRSCHQNQRRSTRLE